MVLALSGGRATASATVNRAGSIPVRAFMENAKLIDAVKGVEAANRAMYDAQAAYFAARAAVVEAAKAAGVTSRVVLVIGTTGWYIDPPGTHEGKHPDGWGITWGGAPTFIPSAESSVKVVNCG